ncbi:MAG: hypothetical protein MJY71_02525 [Bacteroidaceae bacterium]|nr:hypothetical protein [Bacteroidaceae bacterium]
MDAEIVNLSQIQVNGANPRIIKDEKFEKLINSILALPKMLTLRPIVVDETFVALGGNMRYRALTAIADLDDNELSERLASNSDVQKKTQAEQDALLNYWLRWKDKPTAPVIRASELTEDEQREFIIKDNVGFGEWDWDALANDWDNEELDRWGVDVWTDTDAEDNTVETHEDDFDEDTDAIEVRCKRGDVWQLGDHRLKCGDSIDLQEVKELMGGVK